MTRAYGFQTFDVENMAKAMTTHAPISTRQSREIANFLRHKSLQRAKYLLEQVIVEHLAVPFRKHTNGVGHRAGMAAGRYPKNASRIFLTLLKSAEANAQSQGLNTAKLRIAHIAANQAPARYHGGRQGRRKMKRTHVEVVLAEAAEQETREKTGEKQ